MANAKKPRGLALKRVLRNYALAAYHGADKRLSGFLSMAMRVVRARLKYHIGPFHFSLFGFAHVPESQWQSYLIMTPRFDEARNRLSPGAIRGVIDNKILFYEHCQREELPTIPIICRLGAASDSLGSEVTAVEDQASFEALMRSSPAELFIKPISGAHGDGIFRATRHGDQFEFSGHRGTAADLFTYLRQRPDWQAGFIIQPQVRPHVDILPFASTDGLPTVRVITIMGVAGPEIPFACLRIPVGHSITDNFGDGTNGNLVAAINIQHGTLTQAMGSTCHDWPVMVARDAHPDTGHRITDSRMPFWEEIVELVLRAQSSLPNLKTIGWDVAVTPEGVLLVELNSNYGVYTLQVAYKRGLKTELGEKLNIAV